MFCPQCGKQAVISGRYCKFCGSNMGAHTGPELAMSHGSSSSRIDRSADFRAAHVEDATQLRGVGGWLLFFCILVTIISPLLAIRDFDSSGYVLIDIVRFVNMIFGVVVGVHVWSVSKRALRLLMILFSVALCTKLLVSVLLGLDWAYGKPDVAFKLAGEMIGLFMLILWISYFHMSARVKATFGTNL